jgi:uncharacterized PurR-regulated membrane protein YhhQ (DUF165 family)
MIKGRPRSGAVFSELGTLRGRRRRPVLVAACLAMAGASALANYLVQFHLNQWLTLGSFAYAATFLVNELTNRLLGAQAARRVVYVGFAVALPLALAMAPLRIAFAFATAFLLSQLTDIAVFSKLRQKAWWVAPGIASILATALDTTTFFSIAFVGTSHSWWRMIVGDFVTKFIIDLGMLGPFRIAMQSIGGRSASADIGGQADAMMPAGTPAGLVAEPR